MEVDESIKQQTAVGAHGNKATREILKQARIEQADRARRGGDPPMVPANMKGKASAEDVQRWTTYLPAKPPGVR